MGLLENVKQLAPRWSETIEESDVAGSLAPATWDLLMESGVLRSLQPVRFGGGEVHLVEYVDTIIEISRIAPSAGWVAGVIAVHPYQLALFDDQAQRDMWDDDPKRMHSSSYNPTGRAVPVDGGYELSGRWSFSSGSDHCGAVGLGAIRDSGGGARRELVSFILFRDQYSIEDNWNVAGLKGTGSKDIVVDGAFVPEHRTQSHMDYAMGLDLPGQELNTSPLYRLPWSVVFNMALASAVLGATRGFIDCWLAENSGRRVPGGGNMSDDALSQRRIAEATWTLDAAISRLRTDALELFEWAEAGHVATMAERGQKRWNLNRGCELAGFSTVELMRAASGRSLFLDHPLQRRFQDVQAGLSHAYMVADPLARAAGGTLLGTQNPEFML